MEKRNPYLRYQIDPEKQAAGIWFEDEDVRVRVAYAGDENTRYTKLLKALMKPHENKIRRDEFPDDKFAELLATAYAETVILEWESRDYSKDDTPFVPGVYDADGNIVPLSKESVKVAAKLGKRLFDDIQKLATNFNLFRMGQKEDDGKNS